MDNTKIKRPIGITILSILHLIGALLGAIFVFLFFFVSRNEPKVIEVMEMIGVPPVMLLIAVLFLLALVGLSGIGMLIGKKWGWFLGAFCYVYSVARNLNAIISISGIFGSVTAAELSDVTHGPAFYYAKHGIRVIIHALIYLYFFKSNVIEYFNVNKSKRWIVAAVQGVICIAIFIIFTLTAGKMSSDGTIDPEVMLLDKMFDQGDFQGVIEGAKDYLDTHPNSYMVWSQLGWAHLKLDEHGEAKSCFNRAITLEPKWDNAYVGLGVLCRTMGDLDGARENYLKAISIVPGNAEAFSSLLVIELMDGNDKKAVEYGEKAWAIRKDDPTIAANLAIAYHYLGDTEKCEVFKEYANILGYYNMDVLNDIIEDKVSIR